MRTSPLEALCDLLSRPIGSWSLADGACALARIGDPELDPAAVGASLDALGARARAAIGGAVAPRFVLGGLARVLYTEERFAAVSDAENDPGASFLDRALASRRFSSPLLALTVVEVARRAGVRLAGIAIPNHLLLRCDAGEKPFLFDPRRGARPVSIDECRKLVHDATAGRTEFRDGFLRPITPPQFLARLVAQLKAVYWRAADYPHVLVTLDMLLAIRPEDPREVRDRGRVLFLLGRLTEAIAAFENYLAANPRGEDADVVRMLLLEARAGIRR